MRRYILLSLSILATLVGLAVLFSQPARGLQPAKAIAMSSRVMVNEGIQNEFTVCPDGPPTCDFNMIQEAVDVAAGGDTIKVAAGTYTQINNYGGLAQILYLDKSVTIRGGYTTAFIDPPDPDANPTILDAKGSGRVVYLGNESAALVLEGFTMIHGDATGLGGTPYGDDAGGGLYFWGGSPVISDCVIIDNYTGWDGGGIYMRMFSQAQIIGNVISENHGNFGAGIYVWESYPLVKGNLIADNTAGAAGGGVWLGVYSGGAFEHNVFRGNVGLAAYNEGAGGMLGERCTLTLDGNTFRGNSVGGGGSGLTLIRCDATLTNNIFTDNQVSGVGSSLYLTGANAQLYHNTFAGTTGGTPSGIYLDTHWEPRYSQANLVNTILVSETTGIYVASGNTAALEATLWGDGEWVNDTDWGGPGSIVTGTINLWGDPAFIHPQTGDYHITASSPAVDAGIDAGVYTDIDGQPRPNGLGPDIGADEFYELRFGWVQGVVTDLRTGYTMRATIITQGQPYTIITDPETGYYELWLEEGMYTLQASASGYVTQTAEVEIIAQQGIIQDFALLPDTPGLQVAPESLHLSQMVGDRITRALTLTNTGITSIYYGLVASQFTTLRIVSGNNWRVSAEFTPGWETINFNDSSWGCTVAPAPANCGWDHCWDDPDVFTMWSEEQDITIYLRKSFYVENVSSVLSATITTRCDDDQDVYINGILVASDWDGYAGPILVTDIAPYLHTGANLIAIKANDTQGGCRHMCVDAVIHFDATEPDWFIAEPDTGIVPAHTSVSIPVTFDATDLQPGVYPAMLDVLSNDPLNPVIAVPVMMTVTAQIQNRYLPLIINSEPP